MTMVQMNVRIDAKLKNEVEEVLKGKGVSVSDVIRSLWLYIADRKEVPALETTAEEQAREEEKQRKLKLIREGAGYVHKELVKAGLISEDTDLMEGLTYKQFRDKMYDEQLDAYYNMKRADRLPTFPCSVLCSIPTYCWTICSIAMITPRWRKRLWNLARRTTLRCCARHCR